MKLMLMTILFAAMALSTQGEDDELEHTEIVRRLTTQFVVRKGSVPSIFKDKESLCSAPVNDPQLISSPFGPRWKYSTVRPPAPPGPGPGRVNPPLSSHRSSSPILPPLFAHTKKSYDMHRGIDFFPEGGGNDRDPKNPPVPIFAVAAGTVFKMELRQTGGGNTVIIEHTVTRHDDWVFHDRNPIKKYFSYYMHMDTIDDSIVVGANVENGVKIGTMGQTGSTTFMHLHFEIRLEGYCSHEYQVQDGRKPSLTSNCYTGFDTHVHPFLFIGGVDSGPKTLDEIKPLDGYAVAFRYNTSRGHLDFDVLNTDITSFVINTRENIDTTTLSKQDNLPSITPLVSLLPGRFYSTSNVISYDFQFKKRPAFVEVLDIYGHGIRWEETAEASEASGATWRAVHVVVVGAVVWLTLGLGVAS